MRKILILQFLLFTLIANAQVKDLPIVFSKKGYVLAIDFDQKMVQIDFFTTDKNLGAEELLRSQVFTVSNSEITNVKKEKLTINDLRSSDEVLVSGQWFQEKDEYVIQKIIVQSKQDVGSLMGKIDLIDGDFAYIDGNKVKLAEGKKIIGDPKTGYKGQSLSSFSEIKPGIYAKATGKYDDDGYFLARSFTISPDVETFFDKAAINADKEMYDKIYTTWIDPVKRKSLLGKNIEGIGLITNNEAVQKYVEEVGQKLIPSYVKQINKINFIFIVVDNPDLLAYVKANGIAVIYTGLLYNLENEAQLAAVLGHEITHVIYKHQSNENSKIAKNEQKKDLVNKSLAIGTTGYNAVSNLISGKNNIPQKEEDHKSLTELVTGTVSDMFDKNMISYSIEQENQSDRVGLSLAVSAGYDPKEAPIVWKNLYGRYGRVTDHKGDVLNKQIAAFQELQNKEEYNTKEIVNKALTTILTIKRVGYKTKDIKTHPEEIKRYQALNNLIALYWNTPKLLETTTNNEEVYRKVISKLVQTKAAETQKAVPKAQSTEKPKVAPKATPKKKKQ